MKKTSYTKRQRDIISGEVPAEALSSRALASFLNTAISIGDQQTADLIEPILSQKKEEDRLRRNQKANNYYHSVVKPFREANPDTKYELRPVVARSTEYTDYQKRIILGEIPYDTVGTRVFLRIAAVARVNNDFDLANRMEALAKEKHADAIERNRARAREKYNTRRKLSPNYSHCHRTTFRYWERDIIESRADPDDYDISVLKDILEVANRAGDEKAAEVMRFLLAEREDRSIVYVAKTKKEAFDIIENNTVFWIQRPNEWGDKG